MTFTRSRGRFLINVKLACGRSVGLGFSRSAAVAGIMKKSGAHSCGIYEIPTSPSGAKQADTHQAQVVRILDGAD